VGGIIVNICGIKASTVMKQPAGTNASTNVKKKPAGTNASQNVKKKPASQQVNDKVDSSSTSYVESDQESDPEQLELFLFSQIRSLIKSSSHLAILVGGTTLGPVEATGPQMIQRRDQRDPTESSSRSDLVQRHCWWQQLSASVARGD
jgi:hypothetical protein